MTDGAPSSRKSRFFTGAVRFLVPVVVILAVVAIGLQLLRWKLSPAEQPPSSAAGQIEELQVGTVLPDLPLRTLDGKSTRLSRLGAKAVLLNFWATWCEACMEEMPSIVKLQNLYKDQGFQVVAVSLDDKPETAVPRVARRLGMDFPIYTDEDGNLSNLFDVHAIPLSMVIDKGRKVVYLEGGERDWADREIQDKMKRWLAD